MLPAGDYEESKSRNETLDPDPRQKWAEEGYAVVQVVITGDGDGDGELATALKRGLDALVALEECDVKDKFGLIGGVFFFISFFLFNFIFVSSVQLNLKSFLLRRIIRSANIIVLYDADKLYFVVYGSTRDYSPKFGESLHEALTAHQSQIVAIVTYDDEWNLAESVPTLVHFPGKRDKKVAQKQDGSDSRSVYTYPEATSAGFIVPGHPDFRLSSAGVAHTRTLTFLKKHMNGPYFDLEKIWEEHTSFEFANRSVERTMGTMVQEPYVNHIPTVSSLSFHHGHPHASQKYLLMSTA